MAGKARFASSALDGQTVTLSVSKGDVTRGPVTISAWKTTPALTVSVSRYPADNVLPGEVVIFFVTGVSGWVGNDHEDLDFEWNFGESGATYEVATDLPGGQNADVEFGRVVSHAYTTTGVKDVSVTVRAHGQVVKTLNLPAFTVQDPDTVAWDHDIYVDFGEVSGTPDFIGAPVAGGGVRHIWSIEGLQAVPILPGQSTRISFKRGETFTWNASAVDVPGRAYVTSARFGAGARPKAIGGPGVTTGTNDLTFFNPGTTSGSRFAVYGMDFDGTYDPVTGRHNGSGHCEVVNTQEASGGGVLYRSFFRSAATGMRFYYNSTGTFQQVVSNALTYVGMCDVDVRDWSNYGSGQFGGWSRIGITGCNFIQNPLALLRDDKKDSLTEAADHGPLRLTVSDYLGVCNCNLFSSTGWSTYGDDNAVQPCLRVYPAYEIPDDGIKPFTMTVVNIQRNRGTSNNFLNFGRNRDDVAGLDAGYMPRCACVVDRNEFSFQRQNNGYFVVTSMSGVYVRNNVVYYPDSYSSANRNNRVLSVSTPNTTQWSFEDGYFTDPVVLAFNTVVSDRSNASGGASGRPLELVKVPEEEGAWLGAPITEAHNVVWARNHPNAGDFTDYTPLDRAELFRPVTGSAAIDAVSSGKIPVRDFAGNLRGANTNAGAHDTESASAGTVPAPVNATPPTIAALSAFPGEYYVSDAGDWSNWSLFDRYAAEWQWRHDGTPVTESFLNFWSEDGVVRWIADADPGTPTWTQAWRRRNASDTPAQANGTYNEIGGIATVSETINPGLGAHTLWVVWKATNNTVDQGPVGLPSTSTGSVQIATTDAIWTFAGNGDGTYRVTRTPTKTGNLTCRMTATNRSGQRVSAESAAVALGA
ncbi:hypothetical protein P6F26_14420 [Roseibacterium sp. SDUM158017]|uniref:hypothetical protein n=1 Tax=Roseicyclus salinarum TaxID=3036773 RepID=UPI002414D936|nr:hypothetical protein [Roseibacterium sp. SDUM158017]MDG4649636.1 hypothetical protein [Roseibacterium sp. SDUM158017]